MLGYGSHKKKTFQCHFIAYLVSPVSVVIAGAVVGVTAGAAGAAVGGGGPGGTIGPNPPSPPPSAPSRPGRGGSPAPTGIEIYR